MPLRIYKRGKVYWIRGTVSGRRIHESTKTSDSQKAQQIKARREDKEWKRQFYGAETVLTFSDAALEYVKSGKCKRFMVKATKHWKKRRVSEITAGEIRQAAMSAYPDASAATRNRQFITPTQAVINHAADLGLCSHIKVKKFPVQTKVVDYAPPEWVTAFVEHAEYQVGTLALFMFLTAARVSEAISLTWEDTKLSEGTALLRETKNGNDHMCHLPPVLVARMSELDKNREKVFTYANRSSVRRDWEDAIKDAKIKRLGTHSMRHGFATAMLRSGADVKTTMKRGNWIDVQLFMSTYAHAIEDVTITDRIAPILHQKAEVS